MRRLIVALLVAAGAVPLAPARAGGAERRVDAGALRAIVRADPWQVTFTDAAGRVVLSEATGEAPPAHIGFRTAAGWAQARRAVDIRADEHGLDATVETDDPDGRRLAIRLQRDADGVIAYRARIQMPTRPDGANVDAVGIAFAASPDERFFGFGERANAVEHRGAVVESYVADGPWDPEDRDIVALFVPPPGFRTRDDATYFPIPWLLSSRGYGVLVDNDEVVYHDLAADRADVWRIEILGAPADVAPAPAPDQIAVRVFAGPTPADVLRRFTARIGRQPRVRAPWVFGPWFQPGGSVEEHVAQVRTLRAADAPVSVAQTYLHYLPCGSSAAAEPERTRSLHALGVAVTTYFNPMICQSYQPVFDHAAAAGALFATATGEPYIYPYTGSRIFQVGQFDFTAATGRTHYRDLLRAAIADGHDGWMEDFGEYTPLDAQTQAGASGAAVHNRYPVDYHCAAYALTRRAERPIVRFQRSGWTGAARCAPVVWSGDPTTSWGYDGLASVVTTGLGMGLSGVSTWGSDIGGFFGLLGKQLTGELLQRWVQLGAVSGVMRTQRNGFALPDYVRPQVDDEDQIAHWRRWAKFRTQLYPYLQAADAAYQCTGMPIMRHLLLAWPDDPRAVDRADELLFGPDLLVAPVLVPGASEREVYLPPGRWIDFWRAARFDAASGGLVLDARAALIEGGTAVTVPAPSDELPLFARAGSLLPLLPPDVDTLADYGGHDPSLVRLADRADQLLILAFPHGTSSAHALRGDRLVSREGDRRWELALRSRRPRTWAVQASLATLAEPFTPCAVALDGEPLPPSAWSFDPATHILRATVHTRRGRLAATADCAGVR